MNSRTFARRWAAVGAALLATTAVQIGIMWATRSWPGWGDLPRWTYWVPVVTGWASLSSFVVAAWGAVFSPRPGRLRVAVPVGVLLMLPSVELAVWSTPRPGYGAVALIAQVIALVGPAVLTMTVIRAIGSVVIGLIDRRRRARQRPSVDEAVTKWLRSHRRTQQVAVALMLGAATWLAMSTFLPRSAPPSDGVASTFGTLVVRLALIVDELASGVMAGGVILWFQEDRFWGADPKPRGRRRGRHARRSRPRRRWASAG